MENPYVVLGLENQQNATKNEIKIAQMKAMQKKKFPLTEIANAARQLLDPGKRLAADFMYPAKIKAKRPHKIEIDAQISKLDINSINENAFDSLK